MLEENLANKKKLEKAVREFRTYIAANQTFIPNYGDRYRHIAHVLSMAKKRCANQQRDNG